MITIVITTIISKRKRAKNPIKNNNSKHDGNNQIKVIPIKVIILKIILTKTTKQYIIVIIKKQ